MPGVLRGQRRKSRNKPRLQAPSLSLSCSSLCALARAYRLWSSSLVRSQNDAFACDVVQQVRIGVSLRVRPFDFPHGQWLDADAGIEQDVIGNIVHRHFCFDVVAPRAAEDDGYVCIAFVMCGATRPATKQDSLLRRVGIGCACSECACGRKCTGGDLCGDHVGGLRGSRILSLGDSIENFLVPSIYE